MGETCKILMMNIFFKCSICLLGISLLWRCSNSSSSPSDAETVETISILLSRGGREVVANSVADTIVPDNLSDEVYGFYLKKNGALTASVGLGQKSIKTLSLELIERKESIILSKEKMDSIMSFAKKIYTQEEYITSTHPTDSWLVKLQINKKFFIYYLGESLYPLDDLNYLRIIDRIVKESPIVVKDYR